MFTLDYVKYFRRSNLLELRFSRYWEHWRNKVSSPPTSSLPSLPLPQVSVDLYACFVKSLRDKVVDVLSSYILGKKRPNTSTLL